MPKLLANSIRLPSGEDFKFPSSLGVAHQFLSLGETGALAFNDLVVSSVENPPVNYNKGPRHQLWFNSSTGKLFVRFSDTKNKNQWVSSDGSVTVGIAQGQKLFESSGTFTVPAGVTRISAVAVGAGGGGDESWSNHGGSGGALAYATFAVTPGESISITVASITEQTQDGGATSIGDYFSAGGGYYQGTPASGESGKPIAGTVTPFGGRGGYTSANGYGGGGGAGGYGNTTSGIDAFGGNGGYSNDQSNGKLGGGGGGGGYASSTYSFGGGGGVGLFGRGESGTKGDYNNGNSFYTDGRYGGNGGSGGFDGADNSNTSQVVRKNDVIVTGSEAYAIYHGEGGKFGGGAAGGGTSVTSNALFCRGGQGGARIVWGLGREYPLAENVADVDIIE